jgi:hypothetical protein
MDGWINSRRTRSSRHVACMVEMINACKILVLKERDHLEDLGVDDRIILRLILNRMFTRFNWFRLVSCSELL